MEFSWCRVTEEEGWKEPPELTPHRNSASAFVTGTLLIPSCFPCLLLQITNPTSTTTKEAIMGTSLKYCKDRTIPNSCTPSLLADNCTCYRPDSVPAHTPQGGGAALPQVPSTPCKPTMEVDAEPGFQMRAAHYRLPNPCN